MKSVQIFFAIFAIAGGNWLCHAEDSLRERVNHEYEKQLAEALDTERDPCLEFHSYSCAGWWPKQPQDQFDYMSVRDKIKYVANREFQDYFSNEKLLKSKPRFVRQANNFYKSCQANPELNVMHYIKWLKKYEHIKWALLAPQKPVFIADYNYEEEGGDGGDNADDDDDDDYDTEEYDWLHVLAVARKYGMNDIFIEESLASTGPNKEFLIMHLSRNTQKYGFQRLMNGNVYQINKTIEIPPGKKDMIDYYNEVMDFETRLKDIEIKETNHTEEVLQLKDLPFEWLRRYVKLILDNDKLNEEMLVTLSHRSYFEAVDKLIKEYRPARLSRLVEMRFLVYLYQQHNIPCIELTRSLLPMAMSWIFEDLHPLSQDEHNEIQQIFNQTLKYLNQTLVEVEPKHTVPAETLRKLGEIKLKIGNLPRQDTVKILEAYYSNINLNPYHYFSNHLQLLNLYTEFNQKTTLASEWNKNPEIFFDISEGMPKFDELYTRYLPSINVLLLPSYYLIPPIYHPYYENIYKYSSLGTILASGILSSLEIPGINEKDQNMLAHVGSLKAAYHALFSPDHGSPISEDRTIIETQLQNLTQQQLFFVNSLYRDCSWSSGSFYGNQLLAF
ncbi:uncharacterized protein LOC101889416 [Musca domestica]|uniref:Uncharacterized protein LOC101889416 n=1 Tax=Musca domestica TaxID=7370 RepID=A0ABM3UN76_MUSDO|nr:uncharacterized protein LOC101889416 [Musca domestica]